MGKRKLMVSAVFSSLMGCSLHTQENCIQILVAAVESLEQENINGPQPPHPQDNGQEEHRQTKPTS